MGYADAKPTPCHHRLLVAENRFVPRVWECAFCGQAFRVVTLRDWLRALLGEPPEQGVPYAENQKEGT